MYCPLCIYLSIHLLSIQLSICLSIIYLSIYPPIYLLSIYLSVYYLSVQHITYMYTYTYTYTYTGIMKKPKCVPGDRSACVKIEVSTPISIETFNDCRALGRFALRSKGRTCAVGICDSIKNSSSKSDKSKSSKDRSKTRMSTEKSST